ncbi:hypothetical protein KYD79_27290, partial [Escherichia coli]|nr:hypothetical protein [Escherichia coli]
QSHSLEAGEVATSTHSMALRVTGLIESSVFFHYSLMLIGCDSYAEHIRFFGFRIRKMHGDNT